MATEFQCIRFCRLRVQQKDLAIAVPFVCKSWYRASLDPSYWRHLNFRSLDFTPWNPFSRAFALRYRLHSPLSFSAFLSIQDLAYASVKCLRLKALALPDNLMLEDELRIPELVWRWKDLEHLEMETKPSSFLEAVAEIGRNCPAVRRVEGARANQARGRQGFGAVPAGTEAPGVEQVLLDQGRAVGGHRRLPEAGNVDRKGLPRIPGGRRDSEAGVAHRAVRARGVDARIFLHLIFSDVAGDVTIYVDGQSFLLHKFPLVSRSGKIWKMVVESREPDLIPVVHALLCLLLHVCSFVIKNLRPGIQIAGSFKAAILILCCNTFHVAYSFCLHGEACQDDPKYHCPDMWFLDKASIFRRAAEDDFLIYGIMKDLFSCHLVVLYITYLLEHEFHLQIKDNKKMASMGADFAQAYVMKKASMERMRRLMGGEEKEIHVSGEKQTALTTKKSSYFGALKKKIHPNGSATASEKKMANGVA
ncbi:hypothetical protein ZIOFF_033614 [Zingiber officinale]|uniref:F-box protein n=1 Tax=Zingiber officinale TaxID=94328 RepID=A0A8J5GII3_ZINOF|nr:hypothetical protein ZIOFF_033614 [Zingiber officinale]